MLSHFFFFNARTFPSTAPIAPPTNVEAVATSPTSIFVTWEEVAPDDRNGVISMYQVLYRPQQTFGGAIGERSVNVTGLSAALTGLQEYLDYSILVRAYTRSGEGPYSSSITARTHEDGEVIKFDAITAVIVSL